MTIEFKNKTYDNRHGGPFDRGAADSYYGRIPSPHYFTGKTYLSEKIVPQPGSLEYKEYLAGYYWNEERGDKKDWG